MGRRGGQRSVRVDRASRWATSITTMRARYRHLRTDHRRSAARAGVASHSTRPGAAGCCGASTANQRSARLWRRSRRRHQPRRRTRRDRQRAPGAESLRPLRQGWTHAADIFGRESIQTTSDSMCPAPATSTATATLDVIVGAPGNSGRRESRPRLCLFRQGRITFS